MDKLKNLLGPSPTTPWAALIPQIILWSFRRFCIMHLADASDAALNDYVWSDMVDFVEQYAPEGLSLASKWLTPDNIEEVYSSLDDYNTMCTDILLYLDAALMDENEVVQNEISEFLDEGIYKILEEWIVNKELLIFPMVTEDGDVMPVEKCTALIQYLIEYSRVKVEPVEPVKPVEPVEPVKPVEPVEPVEPILDYIELPAAPVAEPPRTAAAAMNYRRTLRNGVSRAITPSRSNRNRTRRAVKRLSKVPVAKEEGC